MADEKTDAPERVERDEPEFHIAKCPNCEETEPLEPGDYICIKCRSGEGDHPTLQKWNGYLEERGQIKDRLLAAEEFAWAFMILISVGGVDIPEKDREFLAPTLEKWSDLAVKTGVMKEGNETE